MALFIAEGYFYTRNLKKYLERLFIFSIISYIPYVMLNAGEILPFQFFTGSIMPEFFRPSGAAIMEPALYIPQINSTLVIHESSVIFTLFLGLFAIYLWDKVNLSKYMKLIITAIIIWLAAFCNWEYYLILLYLIFYFLKDNPKKMWIAYFVTMILYIFSVRLFANPFAIKFSAEFLLFKVGTFLVPIFFLLYNGKPGSKSTIHKWFFYIFYPSHLFILGLIRFMI